VHALVQLEVRNGEVQVLYVVANPDKLAAIARQLGADH
jgi:hypothetical protein